ncbi:alpha-L-arabinofuranosidase C-terminal domain-containing protein [Paraflavitalea pollutisoli]|uniref:alpha-L-arabinofuranosidase C-terminal domain-containing protein n=1 Tax=Paraflavitalea pollutisoli TaxID=3034143 RepID=UPI0023EAC2C7|nr:alpha-L-arabinofuranosidase C-terminal domain-containing protein [Paraflavitalea sp. H1-2-19X]
MRSAINACCSLLLLISLFHVHALAQPQQRPGAVRLLAYGTAKNNYHNGLHFAWSQDGANWYLIGNEAGFVYSDYGRWGSEKKMIDPYLIKGRNGEWHAVWALNDREKIFAHVTSKDLVNWGPQDYQLVTAGANVTRPTLQYLATEDAYVIQYADKNNQYFQLTTKDFKTYTPEKAIPAAQFYNAKETTRLPNGEASGNVNWVAYDEVDQLVKAWEQRQYRNGLHGENTTQDAQRFANLKPVNAKIVLKPAQRKPISNLLTGVFFEDINYAADGGIYAELVQNRGFEYALSDKEGRDSTWKQDYAWKAQGNQLQFTIATDAPLHANNPHYAVLKTTAPGGYLTNTGFDGIPVKKGENYKLSLFTKQTTGNGKLKISLVGKDGAVLATASISPSKGNWKPAKALLKANADAADAHLELAPLGAGTLQLDMVSLFPEKTFMGRENGLRADLAQTVADIHPRFIRFPGGCVAHGDGLHNIYQWKNTIGPLEARVPMRNLWGYHQTGGLGYFEYFRYCEDIGAEPLPVLAAGVPCQNSGSNGTMGGQQGGIPMEQMGAYVQDILDLVEYANGDITTTWGKKRAEAGHPKPFNLKYIGIGNEDLITDLFEVRFAMIQQALKAKYPNLTVIGTVGPFWEGTDYDEGWKLADKHKVSMVDEHYYVPPGWMINNQDFYDKYDRSRSKVYLGEYAAHLPGRPNNLETALAEALYLTSLERNGDVVSMASYAPLLAKEGHTQWNPDLIYFNNTEVKPTVGYHVQRIYGQYAGDQYVPAEINISSNQDAVRKRIAYSVVLDSAKGEAILKLVNLLPVAVTTNVELGALKPASTTADKLVLTGAPADKDAKPVASTMNLSELSGFSLAPYSFTVIRFKIGPITNP